jgi:hypothetical protein
MLNIIASQIGVPSVPSFDPTSITGCKLWLDAADTSSISLSGSAVTQWNDKSGNGYNFAQSTSTLRPSSGTRTQNSKNVIDFDGVNDILTTTAAKSAFNFIHSLTSTFFMVAKIDSFSVWNYLLGDNGGTTGQVGLWHGTSPTVNRLTLGVANGSTAVILHNVDGLITTNAFIAAHKLDPANGTAANRWKVSVNNGAFTGSNIHTSTPSTSNSARNLSIGDAESPDSGLPLDGFVGEVLIYNSILSAGDITSVYDYLSAKWGI